jgi:hypothetical protein
MKFHEGFYTQNTGGMVRGFEPLKVWGFTGLIKDKPWLSEARFHAGNSAENLLRFSAGILLV